MHISINVVDLLEAAVQLLFMAMLLFAMATVLIRTKLATYGFDQSCDEMRSLHKFLNEVHNVCLAL